MYGILANKSDLDLTKLKEILAEGQEKKVNVATKDKLGVFFIYLIRSIGQEESGQWGPAIQYHHGSELGSRCCLFGKEWIQQIRILMRLELFAIRYPLSNFENFLCNFGLWICPKTLNLF